MIVISGCMRIDVSKAYDFRKCVKQLVSETLKEPGCAKYCVSADLEEESIFHFFEEWNNKEALDAHLLSPHMKEFQQKAGAATQREGRKFRIYKVESAQAM